MRAEPRDDAYAAAFVPGLLDPSRPPPDIVAGPGGKAAEKRYAVYRNNVTVSLIDALAVTFPAVERITGESFFRAMARSFVRAHPPTSPLLFEYGERFADFVDAYDYAAGMPWLPDVARIERAWLDAYHAADAEPLRPEALATLAPDRLAEATFTPHPAMRILRSRFPAVSIFAVNRGDGPVGPIETFEPEDALVTRPHLDVEVRRLPPGGAAFLTRLAEGVALPEAAGAVFGEAPDFDLAQNIACMIEAGAFTTIVEAIR